MTFTNQGNDTTTESLKICLTRILSEIYCSSFCSNRPSVSLSGLWATQCHTFCRARRARVYASLCTSPMNVRPPLPPPTLSRLLVEKVGVLLSIILRFENLVIEAFALLISLSSGPWRSKAGFGSRKTHWSGRDVWQNTSEPRLPITLHLGNTDGFQSSETQSWL
jgi:hypothetical protein